MATIYDAIKGEIQTSDEYLADDPFYKAGQLAQAQMVQPQTSSQAVWGPMVQALVGGVLSGIGKRRARETEFDAYSAQLKDVYSAKIENQMGPSPYGATEGIGPVANPDIYAKNLLNSVYLNEDAPKGWTGKQGKTDLLKALVQQEAAAEKQKSQDEFLFKSGLERGPNGEITTNKGMLDALVAQKEALTKAEQLGKAKKDPYDDLSPEERTKYASSVAVAKELDKLADEAAKLKTNALGLLPQRLRADSPYSVLKSKAANIISNVRKAGGDTGNVAVQESLAALESLMGDRTAGGETIEKRLRSASAQLKDMNLNSFKNRMTGINEGAGAVLKQLEESAASGGAASGGIPEGAVPLPGKVQKGTGKQVYMLNGKMWVP